MGISGDVVELVELLGPAVFQYLVNIEKARTPQHDPRNVLEPTERFGRASCLLLLSGKMWKLSKVIPVIQQRPLLFLGNRFPALYQTAGAALPETRVARHCRQLLDSYHCGRQGLARKASESAVSFHTHGGLLAEHGRSLVQHPDPQVGSPRLLRFGPLADPTHSQLHQPLESQPHTLRVDSATGRYYWQGRPPEALT